jgi:hypothetical protein
MSINTIAGLKRALVGRGYAKTESVLIDCMTFAKAQMVEHRNATPLSIIYAQLNLVGGKPKGLNTGTMTTFIENELGMKLDKKEKVISFVKKQAVPDFRVDFWVDYAEEKIVKTPEEKFKAAIASAIKQGIDFDTMLEILGEVCEVEVNVNEEALEAA